ncbi:MAG: hypothetical protein KDA81_14570, partial [Planctomycetaceae bacterium]|nr:hypothetical protein [Planctomycetaceae bacterium]
FRGTMHALRISNSERYTGSFSPGQLSSDADTIVCYDFTEGSGDVLKDVSGHGHDGKIVGATWVSIGGDAQQGPLTQREVATQLIGMGFSILCWDESGKVYSDIRTIDGLPDGEISVESVSHRLADAVSSPPVRVEDLDLLRKLPHLRQVHLVCQVLTKDYVVRLQNLNSLSGVSLYSIEPSAVTDSDLVPLFEKLDRPGFLNLTNLDVNGECLESVRDLSGLTTLNVTESHRKTPSVRLFETLKRAPELFHLDLSGCTLLPEHCAAIAELPKVSRLYISNSDGISTQLGAFTKMSQLKEFYLGGCQLSAANVSQLSQMKWLKILGIERSGLSESDVETIREDLPNCRILSDYGKFEPQ